MSRNELTRADQVALAIIAGPASREVIDASGHDGVKVSACSHCGVQRSSYEEVYAAACLLKSSREHLRMTVETHR